MKMAIPTIALVIVGLFLIGGAGGVGAFLYHMITTKWGVKALWVRRSGVNSKAIVETIYQDYNTGNYLFRTPNENRYKIKILGNFSTIKHEALVDKDDVLEIDAGHCIIGLKELNLSFQAELQDKNEWILNLQNKNAELMAENGELKLLLKEKTKETLEMGKEAIVIPYIPPVKKRTS